MIFDAALLEPEQNPRPPLLVCLGLALATRVCSPGTGGAVTNGVMVALARYEIRLSNLE